MTVTTSSQNSLVCTFQLGLHSRFAVVTQVSNFGASEPTGRPGQPKEFCAPAVFLACNEDSSYVVGAILGVTGGRLMN